MRLKYSVLALSFLAYQLSWPRDIKILVFVIASDEQPIYQELQKIWRTYMHYDPTHVEAYFIKGNPELTTDYQINGDVIWARTAESEMPGIINKTIISMEAFLPRMHEFDYVLRTNLSSLYVFPRLLNFLKNCPSSNFYCGSSIGQDIDPHLIVGSGSGFILSPDLVEMLVHYKKCFLNKTFCNDDVMIGLFFNYQGIKLTVHERCNLLSIDRWYEHKDRLLEDIFQFRIKCPSPVRLHDDIEIQQELVKIFY